MEAGPLEDYFANQKTFPPNQGTFFGVSGAVRSPSGRRAGAKRVRCSMRQAQDAQRADSDDPRGQEGHGGCTFLFVMDTPFISTVLIGHAVVCVDTALTYYLLLPSSCFIHIPLDIREFSFLPPKQTKRTDHAMGCHGVPSACSGPERRNTGRAAAQKG